LDLPAMSFAASAAISGVGSAALWFSECIH
jgi:hypothetical protein